MFCHFFCKRLKPKSTKVLTIKTQVLNWERGKSQGNLKKIPFFIIIDCEKVIELLSQ